MTELRMASGAVWIALLLILLPCMMRTVWRGGATPLDKVLTVTWFLAFNRLCFSVVNLYTPGDQASLAFCQITGAMAGIVMCFVARSAVKAQKAPAT